MFRVLYLSYDGLTDPLGQSQIIPYLLKLSVENSIYIISFEKKSRFKQAGESVRKVLERHHIRWYPLIYTKHPPIVSTIFDIARMYAVSKKLCRQERINLIHARSYIASLVALRLKKRFAIGFLFDMRGFWVDERVEGSLWSLKNPIYRMIYTFFKKKEVEFFSFSDTIVTLTQASIPHIQKKQKISVPIEVIPCCVDTDIFSRNRFSSEQIHLLRQSFHCEQSDCVLSYAGSLGTWYSFEHALRLFLLGKQHNVFQRLLVITTHPARIIHQMCVKFNVDFTDIIVQYATREQMPLYLAASDVHCFFIHPTFSKVASSPTRFAEAMAMNLPVITNAGIGDITEHIQAYQAGYVVQDFSDASLLMAIKQVPQLLQHRDQCRQLASDLYDLNDGVARYKKIYQDIKQKYQAT